MLRPSVHALLVLVLVSSGRAAASTVLCAKPRSNGTFSTTVRIRSGACGSGEASLSAAAMGLDLHGLLVRDADGTFVGTVLDHFAVDGGSPQITALPPQVTLLTDPATTFATLRVVRLPDSGPIQVARVLRTIAGKPVGLLVSPDGFVTAGPTSSIQFDGPDCTGNAGIGSPVLTSRFVDDAFQVGGVLYFRDAAATPAAFATRSDLSVGAGSAADCPGGAYSTFLPPAGCCRTFASSADNPSVVPLTTISVSGLGLSAPFHFATE